MIHLIVTSLFLSVFIGYLPLAWAQERNPLGETAHFVVDTNRQRTSSMIASGSFDAKVRQVAVAAEEPSFDVDLNYAFKVLFNLYSGLDTMAVPHRYFQAGFLEELRLSRHFESADFKIDHLGFKDASTIFNQRYLNCDYLRFYDIDTSKQNVLVKIYMGILSEVYGTEVLQSDIENLEILTHVKFGVPVLGSVKLDASGIYKGMNIIVGADLKPTGTVK